MLMGPIGAPQGLVNMNNYHQHFNSVKNVDVIVFDNSGVFALDKDEMVVFVDLF